MRDISHLPTENDRLPTDPDGRNVEPGAGQSVALSILCHPDLSRVGERVRLGGLGSGERFRLSRTEPIFQSPSGDALGPLATTAVSRSPIIVEVTVADQVVVDASGVNMRLRADGVRVAGSASFIRDDLTRGVVLELGSRVVLLLHLLAPPPPSLHGQATSTLGLIGESSGMARVRAEVLRVADLDVPVLIRGDSGVGKELVADAIHRSSGRAASAFVPVNMAAIPLGTAASALFGHSRGAFTGAVRPHAGFFGEADGGTLFLDEIGAAPLDVQAMLLRVLDTGEVQTVGSALSRRVDVRIIAATDAALEHEVSDGLFRLPLLHRLCGYQIHVPPLAERRDDIARIALHYLREHRSAIGAAAPLDTDGGAAWIDAAIVARLCRFDWPGNVRQLINVTRQMVISSRGYPRLTLDPSVDALLPLPDPQPATPRDLPRVAARGVKPAQIDDETLVAALAANDWSMAATARALNIARSSLYLLVEQSPELHKANALGADEIRTALAACGHDLQATAARLRVSAHGLKMRARTLGVSLTDDI